MKTRALVVLLVSLSCANSWAQERREDRRKFLDPKTQVSDDPRRIVVKPGPRGPEGTIVLRGGRIFDGTGARRARARWSSKETRLRRFSR